jgi:predicted alpha/beta superfamily hydrolase
MSFPRPWTVVALATLLGFAGLAAAAEPTTAAKPAKPQATKVPSGGPRISARRTRETMLRAAPDRRYRILLSVPEGTPPAAGFPVLYVLDADAWFGAAVEIARMREYSKLSPAVVVGVGSPTGAYFDYSRTYDFTPKAAAGGGTSADPLGGADAFREFLVQKLKPWVKARARVDESREFLFGHSLGGLFVLDTVLTAPASFDVYLSASPSVRFSNRAIVRAAEACVAPAGSAAPRLLVTLGGLESHPSPALVEDYRRFFSANPEAIPGQTVEAALAALFADDPSFDKAAETRALAERLGRCGIEAGFAEFPDEEHTASAISALNRGIPFALRGR